MTVCAQNMEMAELEVSFDATSATQAELDLIPRVVMCDIPRVLK